MGKRKAHGTALTVATGSISIAVSLARKAVSGNPLEGRSIPLQLLPPNSFLPSKETMGWYRACFVPLC